MTGRDVLSSSAVETLAGFTAGVATTLAVHPLDLVKTRLQVDRSSPARFGSSVQIIRGIYANEGGIRAFYRGLAPNLIGNSTSWALYFFFYGSLKEMACHYRGQPVHQLKSSDYFLTSGAAGVLTALMTNPIWVIKTRMLATGANSPGAYPSVISGVRHLYRTEGLHGFYRGLVPSLFGVSHGAFQFMAYEKLRTLWPTESSKSETISNTAVSPSQKKFSVLDTFAISGISKVFAGCVTYPYQVIRARLQILEAQMLYRGAMDAVRQVWTKEGISGFYRGLGPNLVRVLPSTWVTFVVYEHMKATLPSDKKKM
ncbi:Uncharacterized protein PECH_000317 [Penicillium ucsense]|uniref:Mitochondrial thiamine pyrophosphate carrier 1 n=1 Tax=Penicillium ucsense TaxID=2839758 RepID=A0A8J8W138_9EURO|nr:Uncharacterized protein PECM_008816 [Penicillium ucsense]KAF7733660.1 Uncharacterized protein PECH_000317 [Penicillium ucsense]